MGQKNVNRVSLQDQVKCVDWLRANWELRVLKQKMSAQQVADTIANEYGIEKLTDGNIRGIVDRVFPQWNFHHAAAEGTGFRKFDTGMVERIEQLENKVKELETELTKFHNRMANLERELGVKVLSSFLPKTG